MPPLADLVTRASGAGTLRVGAGGALYPILGLSESISVVEPPPGSNAAPQKSLTLTVRSFAIASGESPENVGALKASLIDQLVTRGQRVEIVEMGGAARVIKAGGDVAGIAGAGAATRLGWPVTSVEFEEQNSVGAVQFFRVTVETRDLAFAATVSGYNLATSEPATDTERDAANNVRTRVRAKVILKPGQDAAAYAQTQIITPARDAALAAGLTFTSRISVASADASACEYEYASSAPSYGGGGWSTATSIDETDATQTEVAGRVVRTITGTVKGPGGYATALGRALSPLPANTVLIEHNVSLPAVAGGVSGGAVTYTYRYQTGKAGTRAGLTGFVFFAWSQSVSDSGGARATQIATFDNADPIIGHASLQPAAYTETTDFEFTGPPGTYPSDSNIPRATGLDAADEVGRRGVELAATAPGLRRMRVTRAYLRAAPLGGGPPVPVESP